MRARTAAAGSVAALLAGACAAANASPTAMLAGAGRHSVESGAADTGLHHARHPMVGAVAPPTLLSTAARHLPAATPGPKCDATQTRGAGTRYNGSSVSEIYDQLFAPGAAVPYLDSYIPQALENWPNWDGAGHNLILLGSYRIGHRSYLIGLDPNSGREMGTVMVDESHLGGMAFMGDWLFTGDNPWPHSGSPTVQRYRTADLRAAMQRAIATGTKPYLPGDGPRQKIEATDFMVVDGDSMYTANHGNPPVPGLMRRYTLRGDGHLQAVEGPWSIPLRAQGLVITPDDFIYSTDNNTDRGALYVVRRATPAATRPPVACVWMPAMPEDLTVRAGQVISVFESGSPRFDRDHPGNRITHLHTGSLSALLKITDPVAVAAEQALGISPTGLTPAGTRPAAPRPAMPLPALPLPVVPALPPPPTVPLLPSSPPASVPLVPGAPGLRSLPVVPAASAPLIPAPEAEPVAAPTTATFPEPGAPPAGAGEVWVPPQRVSDARDFYRSRQGERAG